MGGTEQRRESNIIKKSLYILFYSTGEPRASRYRQTGRSRENPVPFHQKNRIPVFFLSLFEFQFDLQAHFDAHVLERTTRRKSPATRITSLHRHSFQMFLAFDKSCFSIVVFEKKILLLSLKNKWNICLIRVFEDNPTTNQNLVLRH